ncbi:hypothetical protein D3C77_504470 [compost metagenome]
MREGLLAVQLHLFADRQLQLAQFLLDDPPGPGAFVETQERLGGKQLAQADAGKRGAGNSPEAVLVERGEVQVGGVGRHRFGGDGGIQLAIFDAPRKLCGHPRQDADVQVRMLGLYPHQRRRQTPGQGRMNGADLQSPTQARAADQGVGHVVIGRQNPFGPLHHQVPGAGQADLAPTAVEQRDLQFLLQAADVQADGRGREAEDIGGAGKGAVAGNGHQGAQSFEGHAWAPVGGD